MTTDTTPQSQPALRREYWFKTYTPTEAEMREAWIYMQYAESVADEPIANVQASNFFASHDAEIARKAARAAWNRGYQAREHEYVYFEDGKQHNPHPAEQEGTKP